MIFGLVKLSKKKKYKLELFEGAREWEETFYVKTKELKSNQGFLNPEIIKQYKEQILKNCDLVKPIRIVITLGDEYYIINGNHRLEAYKQLGATSVICVHD